jgi:hypothetical protein
MVVARGFVVLMNPFYNQMITWEPVRQMLGDGASGALLAGAYFGAAHIGLITANLGSVFVAAGTYVDTGYCETGPGTCEPKVNIKPWAYNVVITALGIQVLVVAQAAAKWFQRPGRVSADPTTVAGVVAVTGHPAVERMFASFPSDITEKQLQEALKDYKFRLGTFTTEAGTTKYGIMPVSQEEIEASRQKQGFFAKLGVFTAFISERLAILGKFKVNTLIVDILFGAYLLGLLALCVVALAKIDEPKSMFPDNPIAMRIVFSILGIIVTMYWTKVFEGT